MLRKDEPGNRRPLRGIFRLVPSDILCIVHIPCDRDNRLSGDASQRLARGGRCVHDFRQIIEHCGADGIHLGHFHRRRGLAAFPFAAFPFASFRRRHLSGDLHKVGTDISCGGVIHLDLIPRIAVGTLYLA